jgi:hypothetical protein
MVSQEFILKWENYWYYYKWRTFGIAFFVIIIMISVSQCASIVRPDFNVMFISKTESPAYSMITSLENDITQYVIDFNKDGKKSARLMNIDLSNGSMSYSASTTQFMSELQTADTFIFLIDEATFNEYKDQNMFEKIKNVIPNAPSIDDYRIPASTLACFEGKSYKVGDKTISFKEGLKNYYFVVRKFKGTSMDNAASSPKYENAVKFLKKIIVNSKTT